MYNVVVKKVHVRYLISWWVSCIFCNNFVHRQNVFNNYWHIYAAINLEQNDIKIVYLFWRISFHYFVKCSLRPACLLPTSHYLKRYHYCVEHLKNLNAISYKVWKDVDMYCNSKTWLFNWHIFRVKQIGYHNARVMKYVLDTVVDDKPLHSGPRNLAHNKKLKHRSIVCCWHTERRLFHFVTLHAFEGRTDGRTDRISTAMAHSNTDAL